jgi:hypothetical protein
MIVHAGDKALAWETPTKRGRVNRYDIMVVSFIDGGYRSTPRKPRKCPKSLKNFIT